MWNVIGSNRIIQMKLKKQAYQRHKKALKNIRGMVDVSEPNAYSFLYENCKAKQIAQQQMEQVKYENQNLLRKMMSTTKRPRSRADSALSFTKESLHQGYFRKKSQGIGKQNKKLLMRLADTTSAIDFHKFQKQFKRSEKVKINISKAHRTNTPFAERPLSSRPKSAR